MKVFIMGGSGRIGQRLTKDLVAAGNEVYVGARHLDNIPTGSAIHPVTVDMHAEVDELAKTIGNVDAIYFVAGSRGKDLLQTDAYGAVKTMQTAEKLGVQRFIQLSSLYATKPERWHDGSLAQIMDYNVAKFFADEWLINNTKLAYTILQPSTLTEDAGTGKVKLNTNGLGSNPLDDVAAVLTEMLTADNTIGKVITMVSGDTPVADAVANV